MVPHLETTRWMGGRCFGAQEPVLGNRLLYVTGKHASDLGDQIREAFC